MAYTVNELAELSGQTVRTLHYYDQIGLLCPARNEDNQYRVYGTGEVDKLQQILLYRELGFPLNQIKNILNASDFEREKALTSQLEALIQKKCMMEQMILNVKKTISAIKGEQVMNDQEKFEGFKQTLIEENEKTYGKELRKRFGNEQIDSANEKIMKMNQEEWDALSELEQRILTLLSEAFPEGDPAGEKVQKACKLHKEWLCSQWKPGTYSKEVHFSLAEGYVADPRFTAYYDRVGAGCTAFFRDAIAIYTGYNH